MWLFRTDETSGRRGWLPRFFNRGNGGQAPATKPGGGQAEKPKVVSPAKKTSKPVSPSGAPKPVNGIPKSCPNCEDLESQVTKAQEKFRTITIASGITLAILIPFFIFAIFSLAVLFYNPDHSLDEKWTYLTA